MKKNIAQDAQLYKRKNEHLHIVATQSVLHSRGTLLNDIQLLHQALPELDINDIDLSVEFFDKKLKAPLMITSMTGGAEHARKLNFALAEAAQTYGIVLGVGSQRVMIQHSELANDFKVRAQIPDGVLLGNIGAVQLPEYSPDVIKELVDSIEADGICVHLNAAQELMQAEGHRDFRNILDAIARLMDKLDGRILVKETGAGMSEETLLKLKSIGVHYLDVSGAGGTSWTKVEACRAANSKLKKLGEAFGDWGVPTAFSIIAARKIFGDNAGIVGSGGISTGLDAAKAIVAGADIAGFARPALMAFLDSGADGVSALIESFIDELKTAMLLTGSKDIPALQHASRVYTGELKDWLGSSKCCGAAK